MAQRNLVVSNRHVLSCAAPYITYNLNSTGHQSERPDLLVQLLENHGEEEVAHQDSPLMDEEGHDCDIEM